MRIIVVGENLVDLFKVDDKFEAHPGGSPLNIAVGLARLGEEVHYVSRFSYDFFGDMLLNTLKKENVNTSFSSVDGKLHTTLAFAFVNEEKIPDFEIWNRETADGALSERELSKIDTSNFDIIHFGSILLSTPAAKNVIEFVEKAKENGKFVTFDPNYRPKVAEDENEYLESLKKGWKIADVVKCSLEDARAIFHFKGFEDAVEFMKSENKPIFLTMGSEGAYVINGEFVSHIPSYKTEVVDTTGCGDAFVAGLVHFFSQNALDIENRTLVKAAQFASATAALAARKIGAITSFAKEEEVMDFLKASKGGS